jgi:hypothetical protein
MIVKCNELVYIGRNNKQKKQNKELSKLPQILN